jgi:hypothetical protein
MLTLAINITARKILFPHCMSQIRNVIKQATKSSSNHGNDVASGNTHTHIDIHYTGRILTENERQYAVYVKMFNIR